MHYDDITKIRISRSLSANKVVELVKSSPTDYVMLADTSYKNIKCDDFDILEHQFIIPAVVPFSDKVSGPFGRLLRHINIESNLNIQPFFGSSEQWCFLPFAFIAYKKNIIELLEQCDYCVFLELSLLIMVSDNYDIIQTDSWSASVLLHQESKETRSKLSVKFGTMYSLINPCPEYVDRVYDLSDNIHFKLNKYIKRFGGRNLILTDKNSSYFDTLIYNNTIISVDSAVSSDYYIAMDEETLENADRERTIAQLAMPTVKKCHVQLIQDIMMLVLFLVLNSFRLRYLSNLPLQNQHIIFLQL